MRIGVAALMCMIPAALDAQPVKRIQLKPATATLEAEFIGLTSVRELRDGRAIVTDGRARQLFIADFDAHTAVLLGRQGKGPGEWLNVGFILPLNGDSSIMGDAGNQRLMLFEGAKIVGLVPPDHRAVIATSARVTDIDRNGRILLTRDPLPRAGNTEFTRADSNVLVLVDRSSGRQDTIARLRERPHRREIQMDAEGRITRSMPFNTEPNAQGEVAKLFYDGWLAVVRLEPLRVDWRSPDGRWTLGKPLPIRPEPVDAMERKAIEARRAEGRADAKQHGEPPPTTLPMPTTLPVMAVSATRHAASDGRLLLRRSTRVSNPVVRYLVINRTGVVDGEIILPPNEDIVGFGPRTVYVGFKDDDDIQRLRRHPWP